MTKEPEIIINGNKLSEGQAMTIRVAIESFAFRLEDGLGNDETGKQIAKNYKDRINEIRNMIFNLVEKEATIFGYKFKEVQPLNDPLDIGAIKLGDKLV